MALVSAVILFVGLYWYVAWPLYFIWLATMSVVTFLLYGYDKIAANNRGLRIPNLLMHCLSLIGGFVGGWAGMIVWYHKKSQISFILILALATVVHAFIINKYYYQIVYFDL